MTNKASILLVDDQLEQIYYLKIALELEGFHVFSARNGIDALEIMKNHPIDLVISDVAMPHMNGYQLHQRIRRNQHWVHIPFVMMSGRDMDSDIRFGKELGVDEYLTKPVDIDDMLAVVRGRLKRARQLATATGSASPAVTRFEKGGLVIDFERHFVSRHETSIHLSAKEFALLKRLALQPGEVISLPVLAQATHGITTDPIDAGALLRPLVRSLRRKLGFRAGEMGCIENVRGVGYRLTIAE